MISTGDVWRSERNGLLVREEQSVGASGLPAIRQGMTPGSYALYG